MLNYVLKVSKATPNIAEIIHGIGSGARVPIPKENILVSKFIIVLKHLKF